MFAVGQQRLSLAFRANDTKLILIELRENRNCSEKF
jgi:hypothetical protein